MLLACGFGIVNSVGLKMAGTLTFVITGHLTRLANMFIDQATFVTNEKKTIRKKISSLLSSSSRFAFTQNLFVYGGFFAGAMWASFLLKNCRTFFLSRFGVF